MHKKEGGRAAGFTFTITVMIQSSLIIIPLPGMSAPIENRLYTLHTKQLLGRPGTTLQAQWFTPCSFCVPLILNVCLFQCLCPYNSCCLSVLVLQNNKTHAFDQSQFFALCCIKPSFNVLADRQAEANIPRSLKDMFSGVVHLCAAWNSRLWKTTARYSKCWTLKPGRKKQKCHGNDNDNVNLVAREFGSKLSSLRYQGLCQCALWIRKG